MASARTGPRFHSLPSACLLVLLTATLACGGDNELADLRARLERLEKLNEKLERQNEKLEQQNDYLMRLVEGGAPANLSPPLLKGGQGGGERRTVEQIVGEYLHDLEEGKARAAAEQQKKAEERGYAVGSDLAFKASWRHGLEFQTANGDFRARVRGRIHQDWGWGNADQNVEQALGTVLDGSIFRRLRLGTSGTAYEVMEWVAEMEFSGGVAQPSDVNLDFTHLPLVGNFRVGHFKEPFSLEQLTNDNFITFLDRSLLDEALVPARNAGIMLFDAPFDERMTWAAGLFRSESDSAGFDFGDGEYAYTGRLTALPWYANDGRCLLHLGVAGSHRMFDNDDEAAVRLRTHPEMRAVRVRRAGVIREAFIVDTGDLAAGSMDLLGLEAALVMGPFSLQAEYVRAFLSDATTVSDGVFRGNAAFQGYYLLASWFVTGEHRSYRPALGWFDRVIPHENFFFVRTGPGSWLKNTTFGKGAWELTLRYSDLDLNDAGINGGTARDFTAGLTWYPNPNARFMWNYILAHRDGPAANDDGWMRLLGMHFQWDF